MVYFLTLILWAGYLSRYSDWLRAGWSGIESRLGQDFPPVQTGTGTHPASCKMGTGYFPVVKCGQGVLLTTHPLLVPRSRKSRAIPLPTLWATPVLHRDHFTFFYLTLILRIQAQSFFMNLQQNNIERHFSQDRDFTSHHLNKYCMFLQDVALHSRA